MQWQMVKMETKSVQFDSEGKVRQKKRNMYYNFYGQKGLFIIVFPKTVDKNLYKPIVEW